MRLDTITPELLDRALRNFQQRQAPPAELLQLRSLDSVISPVQRSIQLHDWVLNTVIAQLSRCRRAEQISLLPGDPLATRDMLLKALAADFHHANPELKDWSALYHRYLASVPLSAAEQAAAVHLSSRQCERHIKDGLQRLTDLVRRTELAQTPHEHTRYLPPPDYARLFGVADLIRRIADQLAAPDGPRFISLEGAGGIGKTALARAVAQCFADSDSLAGLIWISARQEILTERGEIQTDENPARTTDDVIARLAEQLGQIELAGLATPAKIAGLRPLLTTRPHLVIIDNLETLADSHSLAPLLYSLSGATRFVLTSRHTLQHLSYAQIWAVPELSFVDSQALLESELIRRSTHRTLSADDFAALHNHLGGRPLALKLVAAQLCHLPLDVVLASLHLADRVAPETLYTFIYRRTWNLLTETARQLLIAMLWISPDGEDAEWLRGLSDLPAAAFEAALAQLLHYSLLEVTGAVSAPHYHLHRLTVTFLKTDLLQRWQHDA